MLLWFNAIVVNENCINILVKSQPSPLSLSISLSLSLYIYIYNGKYQFHHLNIVLSYLYYAWLYSHQFNSILFVFYLILWVKRDRLTFCRCLTFSLYFWRGYLQFLKNRVSEADIGLLQHPRWSSLW